MKPELLHQEVVLQNRMLQMVTDAFGYGVFELKR